jgi:hypothetical protein
MGCVLEERTQRGKPSIATARSVFAVALEVVEEGQKIGVEVHDLSGWSETCRCAARQTAATGGKLCGIDPKAWLDDVLGCIADHPASRIHDLLPWSWRTQPGQAAGHLIGPDYPAVRARCLP